MLAVTTAITPTNSHSAQCFILKPDRKGLSEGARKDVLQEKMDVADDANVITASTVHGNNSLDCKLVLLRDVEQPRVDGAGGLLLLKLLVCVWKLNSVIKIRRLMNSGKPRLATCDLR